MSKYKLSLLLLTEGSSKDAHQTMSTISRKLLQLIVPAARTDRIHFEPANEKATKAMRANSWKSTSSADHHKRVDLVRSIATKLGEETPGFVLFHFDGDRPWSDRQTSENVTKLDQLIITAVP